MASNFLCYAVLHNNHHALLLENISLYFVLKQVFFLRSFFLSFPPSSYALLHTLTFEHDCTALQYHYMGCIQSNQQLALGRLMHSIHCASTIFPYQTLERRQAQETSIGCEDLLIIKNLKALNVCPVYGIDKRKIQFTYMLC
jgi:hypothetical protein